MSKDDPTTQEIVRLYSQGMSAAKVGKIVCLCEQGVNYRLKLAGGAKRIYQTRHITQSKIDQIRALNDKGLSQNRIADIVGVSIPTIHKYIKNKEINYA